MKETIAAIVTAVIGLAIVAVLVSNKAQTPQVFQAAGSSLASIIGAATSPVTGNYGTANNGSAGTPMFGNLVGNPTGNYTTA